MLNFKRLLCTVGEIKPIVSRNLIYREYGDPLEVLKDELVDLEAGGENSVTVQMIACPINPSDINQIQGQYPVRPKLPATAGNEGVGKCVYTGERVSKFKAGDLVIPSIAGFGTWRNYAVCHEDELIKIPGDIPIEYAASISINPCTAYRMIKDYVDLQEGDYIMQNGATSGVGRAVIQIAANMGYKTINVIRDRETADEERRIKDELIVLGAHLVVTETEARSDRFKKSLLGLHKPKLGFNCIGGKSAINIASHLAYGGKLITCGGMSKEPLAIPLQLHIFAKIELHGFWLSKWNQTSDCDQRQQMMDYLFDMIRQNKFKYEFTKHRSTDYKDALHQATKYKHVHKKNLLIFDP